MSARAFFWGFVCLFPFCLADTALARLYEARHDDNTDIIYIDDSRVDFALREKIIREARYSLDVISMSQTADGAGLRILRELRGAQQRGVRVRYMVDSLASTFEGDVAGHAAATLVDSSLPCPGNVICVSLVQKWWQGLSYDDFLHEKILIADAGTPYERILVGGRNHTQKGLFFIDSSFLIRPLDHQRPYLGTDLRALYARLWDVLRAPFGEQTPQPLAASTMRRLESGGVPELVTEPRERREYEAIAALLDRLPRAGDELAPNQFRPSTTQVVSNDTFEQLLRGGVPGRSIASRARLEQDIVTLAARLIRQADDVDITSYVVALPPAVQDAVVDLFRRNGSLRYFTNGRAAHGTLIPRGIALDYTYPQADYFMRLTRGGRGNFELFLLDAAQIDRLDGNRRQYRMLHRKHIRAGNWCLFGSDNFTPTSAVKNDEFAIAVEDPRMAAFFRRLADDERPLFQRMTPATLAVEYGQRPWYSDFCVRHIIRNMY